MIIVRIEKSGQECHHGGIYRERGTTGGQGQAEPLGETSVKEDSQHTVQDGSESGRRSTAGSAQHTQQEPLPDV